MNDDAELALFEPWVILPSQIAGGAQQANRMSGPIALMLAVLDDAVRCIERGRRRRHRGTRKLAAEAEAWMRCDSREWVFAFASICDVLGLDVEATRACFLTGHDSPSTAKPISSATVLPRKTPLPALPRPTLRPYWAGFGTDDVCLSGASDG